ncbi:Uncharacterised protein [Escherichia coli]|uniref:Uncharacterized protein n=1 Tax=Escherichia coli TaxID=562 RepID=A0A2X3M247_ECOLX|nr:Uncharacterised protein [Escherichia coli]
MPVLQWGNVMCAITSLSIGFLAVHLPAGAITWADDRPGSSFSMRGITLQPSPLRFSRPRRPFLAA